MFSVALGINDQFKTLFSIRRESMIHWTYGYKVAVLILLEKEPLLREAKLKLIELKRLFEREKSTPRWLKKLRNQPPVILENIEAHIQLLTMQIRDVEMEIAVAKGEIERFNADHRADQLTYEEVQSLSGEAFASKVAENAAIATWAMEHQLPEEVARAVFDSQVLPPVEQALFFKSMSEKIINVEKQTLSYFQTQAQVGEFLVNQVDALVKGN